MLNAIVYPTDLKTMPLEKLQPFCDEIRTFMIESLAKTGGHVGSNLGVVELTVALHYVFDAPKDKIVWDVSHQCYVHKILTGRKEGIAKLNSAGGVSGFTNINESEYDLFNVGHTSVAISLAAGLAKARDLRAVNGEHVIAVIGDGALSGGQSFEALQSSNKQTSRLIIVINDNETSIDPNNGSLYDNLKLLRNGDGKAKRNYFKALGYDYIYEPNGNDVLACILTLEKTRRNNRPIVAHFNTQKSKGLPFAQERQSIWHYHSPFDLITGKSAVTHKFGVPRGGESEAIAWASPRDATSDWFKIFLSRDKTNAIVVPATQFVDSRAFYALGNRYIDLDIGEQNAVSFAAGMAKGGSRVFLMIQSSFLQRAYDQIAQDWCMQNLGVCLIVVASGISSLDYSHVAMFDIALLSNIPNLVYLSPSCLREYLLMLEWCAVQKTPTAIRLASGPIEDSLRLVEPIALGKFETIRFGKDVAILGLGKFLRLANEIAELLITDGIEATVINPRFIVPIDLDALEYLKNDHRIVVTIEDGILEGGFGAKIALFYASDNTRVLNFGAKKEFIDHVPFDELMNRYELTAKQIAAKIKSFLWAK
ncbi:MAG: 1-deoxy-D-xylulose-5-phosphate synthase [Helicobacteraceae bacterium]|jgi:1-deoxy-D-xylulose-5-phosphate synthase|nr:1-deoxy-D-xylulose-5-phosphate synthase [Helicobacteraceae bacterium]